VRRVTSTILLERNSEWPSNRGAKRMPSA
jgi:hypothetical protein